MANTSQFTLSERDSPRLGYIDREGLGRRRTGTSARDVFEDKTDICIERENARRLGEMACKGRQGRRSSLVELLVYSRSIFLRYLISSYLEAIEQKSICGDRSSLIEVLLVYFSVSSMAELRRNERMQKFHHQLMICHYSVLRSASDFSRDTTNQKHFPDHQYGIFALVPPNCSSHIFLLRETFVDVSLMQFSLLKSVLD